MKIKLWPEDTIARRFALTIAVAIVVALGLTEALIQFSGIWGRPSIREIGLLQRADDIVQMVEAAPARMRPTLANAVADPAYRVDWYSATSAVARKLDAAAKVSSPMKLPGFESGGHRRKIVYFTAENRQQVMAGLSTGDTGGPHAYYLSAALKDGSWVIFMAPSRVWGIGEQARIGVVLALLIVSIAIVSAFATYQLSRPIREFTEALRRFGTDPRAAPISETGPRELRASIAAFNAMQAQIQKFVDDRTTMLAAISHDLRTPLTRIRLRGEFVEDGEQRMRLFRDVDDMQGMVDSALAFFRDDFQREETTTFDFPEMLRTIADDYSDQGAGVSYEGPERVAFRGRPLALKRAFANLVDNAVKYGRMPELELCCSDREFVVIVRDSGPGIPPEAAEQVFTPFFRLERSRNRGTGGAGLGLTSAQTVIRGHGGDIRLRNLPTGGLEVRVTLPTDPQLA
jgi:signal transduction histidine kinase